MTNEDSIGTLASPNPALSSRGEIYLNIYFIYINEGWDRKAKRCSKEILAKGKGREREREKRWRTHLRDGVLIYDAFDRFWRSSRLLSNPLSASYARVSSSLLPAHICGMTPARRFRDHGSVFTMGIGDYANVIWLHNNDISPERSNVFIRGGT